MKIFTMTKGKAFAICMISIMVIFISMYVAGILKTNLEIIPVSVCLTALVTITTCFLGLKIADSGIKGKCWNQQMYEALNGKVEGDSH